MQWCRQTLCEACVIVRHEMPRWTLILVAVGLGILIAWILISPAVDLADCTVPAITRIASGLMICVLLTYWLAALLAQAPGCAACVFPIPIAMTEGASAPSTTVLLC